MPHVYGAFCFIVGVYLDSRCQKKVPQLPQIFTSGVRISDIANRVKYQKHKQNGLYTEAVWLSFWWYHRAASKHRQLEIPQELLGRGKQ